MADKSKIELVIEVDPSKGNAGIKSINTGLSSMEQSAVRATRSASQGMDGFTSSMVKGAAVGNLLAEGIRTALGWLKQMTVEVAKYASRTEVMTIVSNQLAKVNNVAAGSVDLLIKRITGLGITTQEAHGVIQRMIFAELDLAKAIQLARVAQDAAVIANVNSSEALENIILGITTGQTRLLHNMGLQVSLEQTIQAEEKRLGRAITESEKRSAMLNKVLEEGVKIRGTYEAAMQSVGKQMTSLPRYFAEAKNAIGERFMPEMRKVIDGLKDLAIWLKDNSAMVADLAKVIATAAGIVAAAGLATKLFEIVAALRGLVALAAANPIGLIAAGVVGAGAILYSEWRKMEAPFRAMDEAYQKWLQSQITGAKTGADLASATDKVEKAFAAGTIGAKEYAQAMDMLDSAKARVYGWGDLSDFSKNLGLKIKIPNPKEEAAAAAALAEEIRKEQLSNDKAFRDRALEASRAGLTGLAKDMADVNAEIGKRNVMVDKAGVSHYVPLTKAAWKSIIEELQYKLAAFKHKLAKDNREHLADYLKAEEEAAHKRMEYETRIFQQRLANDEEIAKRNLEHIGSLYQIQEERAGYVRDKQLRDVDGMDAQTLQQKIWVEGRKSEIEIEYLEKVHEIKMRLFDLETSRMVLEEEANMNRLGYRADEVKARIAELSQQREDIRQATQEGTDASIDAARQNAANRQAQMVRDHNRQVFESLKQQAGGVFDALLTKSQSVWQAIGNSFKTAILTAIKEVVTSRVAAMLMQLFTGQRASFAGGASPGGLGGMLGGLGGMLGVGSVPVFGGSNSGPIPGGAAGGWGTPPFISGGSGTGGWAGGISGWAGGLANLKSFFGIGGSIETAPGVATTWESATLGQKLSSIGRSNASLMGGGLLAIDGVRRGGWAGLAETTGGGALIGAKFGGPLGALIGAGAGLIGGLVGLFRESDTDHARKLIKQVYQVDISDKQYLQKIVDIAKQSFAGSISTAVYSPQVRELVELYSQTRGGSYFNAYTPRAATLANSGGALTQSPFYVNGSAYAFASSAPTTPGSGAVTRVGSASPQITLSLDPGATKSVLNGRATSLLVPGAIRG
jgi:hypothetical protein